MKTKTIPASYAALSLVPKKEGQTVNVGFPDDFQDLCSRAMDRAIGIEKASLTTDVGLNSSVIDIYKNAFWFAPVFCELLDTATKSFAFCTELQMSWLTLMMPHASGASEALLPVAAPSSTVASSSESQAQPTAEVLESSMDIAIGERDTTQDNKVMSNSGSQTQPTAEVPDRSMGIAMRARAA
jgi:hypothetical protein